MTSSPGRRLPTARTLGALAVGGVVLGFSLSSTLAKRAETPGVLLAFWRLTLATLVFNLFLRGTGRRLTMRHLRQALVPGAFFGLNLAVFFAGATNNSVANAALIGSMAPFLVVPVGARLFGERYDRRALAFAVLAFGGLALVLFSAPAKGDATVQGNIFGFVAMFLLVAYVVSTRQFRRGTDVTTFMAAICPIGAVAVLPIAAANGDGFTMSGRGWAYLLILTLLSGVAANGLMVYAQQTIQIGTIAVAQVVNPAVAVGWSFLLLGETLRLRQAVGIALAIGGLAGFVVLNHHGERARVAAHEADPFPEDDVPPPVAVT